MSTLHIDFSTAELIPRPEQIDLGRVWVLIDAEVVLFDECIANMIGEASS